MEISGYLKIVIVLFAVAIPITVVFLVYRIVFAGFKSMSTSKKPAFINEDTPAPEPVANKKSTENNEA